MIIPFAGSVSEDCLLVLVVALVLVLVLVLMLVVLVLVMGICTAGFIASGSSPIAVMNALWSSGAVKGCDGL